MFSEKVENYLANALDIGLREHEFWDMTLAELTNYFESFKRRQKTDQQEKATFDYILGDLIGRSIARVYNADNTYPKIYEIYPTLFDKEEMEQAEFNRRMELSALKLQEFTKSFNEKFMKKEVELD